MVNNVAWFRNYYLCHRCDSAWSSAWSCMADDDCPRCGARHMSPFDSDDLTNVIHAGADAFVVLHSPDTAEERPAYQEIATFKCREHAEDFIELVLSE